MIAPTTFHGMRPWPVETEIVECRGTAIGTVDLHNEADLVAVTVETAPAGLSVIYSFGGAGDQIATDVLFALRFSGVRDLRLWQADPLTAGDQAVFHAVDLIRGEDGNVVFGLHATVFESTFTTDGVTFEVDSRSAN